MKATWILIPLVFLACTLHAQDPDISEIQVNKETIYKALEPSVLESANFVLSGAVSNSIARMTAMKNIITWMTGTLDYQFEIDSDIGRISKKNDDLIGVYMAAMSKYVLEHPETAKDNRKIKYNTYLIFLTYCENAKYGVKRNKELDKAIKAKDENKLTEWFKPEK